VLWLPKKHAYGGSARQLQLHWVHQSVVQPSGGKVPEKFSYNNISRDWVFVVIKKLSFTKLIDVPKFILINNSIQARIQTIFDFNFLSPFRYYNEWFDI
jgi:hypothetical protein